MRFIRLLALLLTLPLLFGALPDFAESADPGPEGEAFAKDLAEDALVLTPLPLQLNMTDEEIAVEARRLDAALAALGLAPQAAPPPSAPAKADDFYASIRLLSLSPDGRLALASYRGGLWLYAPETGRARAVVPEAGFREPGQYQNWEAVSRAVETQSLCWSPDGASLLVSSPRSLLTRFHLGTNVYRVDAKAATVRPLFPALPAALVLTEDVPGGVPLRAAFSPDGRLAFVETLFLGPDGMRGEIQAVDPQTGTSARVADFDPRLLVTDGRLWALSDAFLQATAETGGWGAAGLLVTGLSGQRRLISYARPFHEQRWPSLNLLGAVENAALLRAFFPRFSAASLPTLLHLIDPGDDAALLDEALALREDSPGAERLLRLPVQELMAGPPAGVTVPDNAALSPDGRRLLLAVRDSDGRNPRLYLHDLASGLTGRLTLPPEARKDGLFACFAPPMSDFAAGIQWAGNNRLLLWADGAYRAFALSVAP